MFASNRDGEFRVYTLDLDGSSDRLVTPGTMIANFPSWSPEGDSILFSGSTDGNQYDLYTVKPDGSRLLQLTRTGSLSEREGVFSPDGRWIAFEATPPDAPREFERSIYVLKVDSGQVRKLTQSKFHDTSPSWVSEQN